MTETAGVGMPFLAEKLHESYPDKAFELINQGVGGTRVGYGYWRLSNDYEFKGIKYQSLLSLNPDIVLLESFAYNNGSDGPRDGGIDHLRRMHYNIIETIREKTDAVVVAVVTIAPNTERFLETVPNFVHTPVEIRRWMAQDRMAYLEEFEKIAAEFDLPTVNVYRATLNAFDNGVPLDTYINQSDCIHPSDAAHELTAKLIVETFKKHNII